MSNDEKPAGAPAEAIAPPRFVNQQKRFRTIPLEWPLEYDGKIYDAITVRRMTAQEVADWQGSDERTLPMVEAPLAVIDALDADDALKVNEAIHDFLPHALREAIEPAPPTGEPTPQSPPSVSADSASTGS